MELIIRRFLMDPKEGTFSMIYLGRDFQCFAVEQPWRDNTPYQSCIPGGIYQLHRSRGNKYPGAPMFVNPDLRVHAAQTQDPRDRFACLIHSANRADELKGCLAPGQWLGIIKHQRAVTASGLATTALLGQIAEKGITRALILDDWRSGKLEW